MQPSDRPRIKICCIQSVEEAWTAIRYGASALGLVSAMPSGPGVIDEDLIAHIAQRVPPAVATFLLTSQQGSDNIIEQQYHCGVNTIQLCDALPLGEYPVLRAALPGIALVQVIHVTGVESIDEALTVAPYVNGLLLDSGNPNLTIKELGGTGRVHNWEVSRRIREAVDIPVFLAGGLKAENAAEAVRRVGPFGLDVCSGVRTDGDLDEEKVAAFCQEVLFHPPEV
jgi:phosphoribosylanthranilate isomerase